MRNVQIAELNDSIREAQQLYGHFDIGLDGLPTPTWVGRNLCWCRFDSPLRHAYFPEIFVYKAQVNHRMRAALLRALRGVEEHWTAQELEQHGLLRFVKAYCFGDGWSPNLHWYGAAWELPSSLNPEHIEEMTQIFIRAGFSRCRDKKRIRTLEYW